METVTFSADHPPVVELTHKERSEPGSIVLASPHAETSSHFAFRVFFDPPLKKGESLDLTVSIDFPVRRVATRDQLVAILMHRNQPVRDYDYAARTVALPVERLRYEVRIPKSLAAVPLEPQALRYSTRFTEEERYIRSEPGVFSLLDTVVDGEPTWVMRLERANPPYRTLYRLRWRLPRAADLVPG